MLLKGSCHCGAVKFFVQSSTPVPVMRCYCSICRKTTGGGGYAINLGAHANTLKVEGKEHTRIYHAKMRDDKGGGSSSSAERHFCGLCGTHLRLFSPEYPELVHPLAAAVDSELLTPPEHVDIMLRFKANWVELPHADQAEGPGFKHFQEYPMESLEDWHKRHSLLSKV